MTKMGRSGVAEWEAVSEHGEGNKPVDSPEINATGGPESADPASSSTSDVASENSAQGGTSPADAVPDPAPEPPSPAPTSAVGQQAEAIGSTTNSKVRSIMAKIMADIKRDKSASSTESATVVIGAQAAGDSSSNETPTAAPTDAPPAGPTSPTESAASPPSAEASPAEPTIQVVPTVEATPASEPVADKAATDETVTDDTVTDDTVTDDTVTDKTEPDGNDKPDEPATPDEPAATATEPAGQPATADETAKIPETATPDETAATAETTTGSETPATAETTTVVEGGPAAEKAVNKAAPAAEAKPSQADASDKGVAAAAKTTGVMPSVVVAETKKSRGKAASLLRAAMFIGLAVVGLYALLALAWGIDVARHQDLAMRGVRLGETNVGGFDEAELETTINEMNASFMEQPVELLVGDTTFESDAGTLGAHLDSGPMVTEALNARRQGSILLRPIRWVGSFFSPHDVKVRYAVDSDIAITSSAKLAEEHLEVPIEPELLVRGGQMVVSAGETGTTIAPRELIGRLPVIIAEGDPYKLELLPREAKPRLDTEAMEEVADEVNEQTSQPILVKVLDKEVEVDSRMQRAWVLLEVEEPGGSAQIPADEDAAEEEAEEDGAEEEEEEEEDDAASNEPSAPLLSWSIDEDAALEDLKPLFPSLGSEDQQAKFSVVDGEPIIIPASETVVCCETDSGERLGTTMKEAIPALVEPDPEDENAEEEPVQPLRTVTLRPVVTDKDEGVAELESLGIVEEVSTFTTKHSCCQNRVKNIQRFADLTQGVIIRPGEEFSLNEFVGQRTRDKGFVADGAIAQGVIEPQVGGGISQYATTFFNATFFAGLEFVEYQSHSIYISRYPRGREATISWRKPDLKIRNNTEYGILVWNEYTPTSISVTFYSTKHLEVEALPLRRASERQCRVDITPRVITYEDGTTAEDSVKALYRPGEGLDCNGNSTRPDED